MKHYMYIISHPLFNGWYKVGRTRNLIARLSAYNTCCPYKLFKYEKTFKVSYENALAVEEYIKSMRYSSKENGEWVKINTEQIEKIINDIGKVKEEKYVYTLEEKIKIYNEKNILNPNTITHAGAKLNNKKQKYEERMKLKKINMKEVNINIRKPIIK